MGSNELTHLDDKGNARMVDVGSKLETAREAVAHCRVLLAPATFDLVRAGNLKKGDVLTVAQVAGIQAAKRTWELIPLCHQINMSFIGVTLTLNDADHTVDIEATAR
ncbi:MAG: cyclic pyranopterin monophosphate synthase MoaC, partial [Caldiserica bacterium]|nr:cyclic pyranopterin monophosphate synthase MoaC [Caldisericota bacterium]